MAGGPFRHKSPDGIAVRKLTVWTSEDEQHVDDSPYEACATVTVSSAEILALNATPKTIVAAPGAGKYIEFISATLWLDYNSAAYAGVATGEDLVFKWTDDSGSEVSQQIETTGFLDQTSDQVRTIGKVETVLTPAANAALVLHLLVGEVITGDSPINVSVRYRVWPSNPVAP